MLTQEKLKEVLNYNPSSGVFTWLVDRGRNKTKGIYESLLPERAGA